MVLNYIGCLISGHWRLLSISAQISVMSISVEFSGTKKIHGVLIKNVNDMPCIKIKLNRKG